MANNESIPQVCSLQLLVLHGLAKQWWHVFFLQDPLYNSRLYPDLFAHFIKNWTKIANALPKTLPAGFPKLLRNRLNDAVINLQLGYREAFLWEDKHKRILPFSILYSGAGEYEASHFITPYEHFDDVACAMRFVDDENQHVWRRFQFACEYCFEDRIFYLWHYMRDNNLQPYEGGEESECIMHIFKIDYYMHWWIYYIPMRDGNFYIDGFHQALSEGHEYATRYFWRRCSPQTRESLLYFVDLHRLISDKNITARHRYFLYSLLTLQEKRNMIALTSGSMEQAEFWSTVLSSGIRKAVLNDILTFPYPIPPKFFENVLVYFILYVKDFPAPAFAEAFTVLWNQLSEDHQLEIVKLPLDMYARNLPWIIADFGDIDLFETVVLPLPLSVKEELLLERKFKFFDCCIPGDYDKFLCYLILLFLDYNPVSHQLKLRFDAAILLDNFINYKYYVYFIRSFSGSDAQRLKQIVTHFKITLPVIDEMTKKVRDTTDHALNYRKFLSFQIYPLLSLTGDFENINEIEGRDVVMEYEEMK